MQEREPTGGAAEDELWARLRQAAPEARAPILREHIRREVVAVLGARAPQPLSLEAPFRDLGLNSMMTVNLWARLGDALHTTLSPTLAFQYPTINELAEYLARELDSSSAAPAAGEARPPMGEAALAEQARQVAAHLRLELARVLGVDPAAVAEVIRDNALDPLAVADLCGRLETSLAVPVSPDLLERHPTVESLARALAALAPPPAATPKPSPRATRGDAAAPVAIIGLACRFPGAKDAAAYWRLLESGTDAISEVPSWRWDVDAFFDPRPGVRGKIITRQGGFIERVQDFDAGFFGISPREAAAMDPQQRLLLEVSWEALEHAGVPPHRLHRSKTGIFIGVSYNDYYGIYSRADVQRETFDIYAATGNTNAVAAGRLAYFLGTQGPAYAIDTACSSSLVAVHLACKSLRDGEIDLAIVGGVNLILSPETSISLSQAGMLAPDGRCKTFDAGADGYVRSEGCGVVVLRRLADAEREGSRVLAAVRGSATNQDGRSNGLTAPNGTAQEAVIRQALEEAQVAPEQIDYLEVHGTGTSLGDPVEVRALGAVLAAGRAKSRRLVLGAAKTNLGHLEAAAGIAGLIKVCLALEHESVPPNLHLRQTNPLLPVDELPFELPVVNTPWRGRGPRLAAVSSFGFSGTNAHLVVEGPRPAATSRSEAVVAAPQLFTLSAQTPTALAEAARRYAAHLKARPGLDWASACRTTLLGRSPFEHRLSLAAASSAEAVRALEAFAAGDGAQVIAGASSQTGRPLAFVFGDTEPSYAGLARELYDTQPAFRQALEACVAALAAQEPGATRLLDLLRDPAAAPPEFAPAATFALEYALAAVLQTLGVRPQAVSGRGVGELVAAAVAGLLPLGEAVGRAAAWSPATGAGLGAGAGAPSGIAFVPEQAELGEVQRLELRAALLRGAAWLEPVRRFWVDGGDIDWRALVGSAARTVVSLPSYPFERRRYWVEVSQPTAAPRRTDDVTWEIAWRARDPRPAATGDLGAWHVIGDGGGAGRLLHEALVRRGLSCTLAAPGEPPALAAAGPLRVVHLAGLEAGGEPKSAGALAATQQGLTGGLVELCQRLIARGGDVKLWVVTERAQRVMDAGGEALQAAPLWGLGRVLAREQSGLWGGLVDLEDGSGDSLAALVELLLAPPDGEEEHVRRSGRWYSPRLVRHVPSSAPAVIDPGGTYLVTGGLGGLGRALAEWLAGKGARRLVLLSRRASEEAGGSWVAELRRGGVEVRLEACDVAEAAPLERVLGEVRSRGEVLKGVFHCAGIDDPVLIDSQRWERFAKVMGPKVWGAWNLHLATRGDALDFFVCYSSVASIVPFAGQAAYAAANAFLDALVVHRRRLGLPGLAVSWGPWSQVGMAAGIGDAKSTWARGGPRLRAMSPRDSLSQLERLLGGGAAHAAVLDLDLAGGAGAPGIPAALGELVSTAPAARPTTELLDELANAPSEARPALMRARVSREICAVLGRALDEVLPAAKPLMDLGMDSLMAVELRHRLSALVGEPLPATLMFDQPSLGRLATYLLERTALAAPRAKAAAPRSVPVQEPIAIVGMACRFPGGANDLASYWRLLSSGEEGISEVPPDRWDIDAYYDPDPDAPDKMSTRRGGFLKDVDVGGFDPEFFGISPREAKAMDPQQRLLLEVSWEALEDAGLPAPTLGGSRTGVFVAISTHDYEQRLGATVTPYTGSGNLHSVAPGRVSYTWGFQGPSMAIDTGCSSSLSALHFACQSLRSGDSDLALVGGVNLMLNPTLSVYFSMGHFMAPDGRCKTFDAGADGYVRSEGCGFVVLKRLSEAQRDGDHVWAVVRATAVNQDGRSAGLTAPNGPAQERLIEDALARARLEPGDLQYLEAHGTGTQLGDAIELGAVVATVAAPVRGPRPLAVGSVKTNVGHLEAAAGLAGLVKLGLALTNEELPPHLNLRAVNPKLPVDAAAVVIPTRRLPWPRQARPRLAGMSGFAFQGSNAHAVLEEAPLRAPLATPPAGVQLLALSAHNEAALEELCRRYAACLKTLDDAALPDLCVTASLERSVFVERVAVVGASRAAMADALLALARRDQVRGGFRGKAPVDEVALETARSELAGLGEWWGGDAAKLEQAAALFVRGAGLSVPGRARPQRKLFLPAYPYQRQRYWLEGTAAAVAPRSPELEAWGLAWREQPLSAGGEATGASWVVLGELGQPLTAAARAAGLSVVEVSAKGVDWYDGGAVERWWQAAVPAGKKLAGVLHAGALAAPAWDAPLSATLEAQKQLAGSVGALSRLLSAHGGKLWLLSRGAARVGVEKAPVAVAQAAVFGLGRTLAQENGAIWGGLVDLDPDVDGAAWEQQLGALLLELAQARGEQVALRGGKRHVARLTRLEAAGTPLNVRADAYYLVTGGLGGIGFEVARWLAARGAKKLALVGRSGARPEVVPEIEALRAGGVEVRVGALDVGDGPALSSFVAGLGARVRGVVHAAGVIRDQLLTEQRADDVAAVLWPKLGGVAALEQALAGQELDFTIVFSSLTSWLGGLGQASYAAANAVLDAMADEWARRGRPCVAIGWGPWAEVGMASRLSEAQYKHWRRQGIQLVSNQAGLRCLASLAGRPLGQVAAGVVDWSAYARSRGGALPLVAELAMTPPSSSSSASSASSSGSAPSAPPPAAPRGRSALPSRQEVEEFMRAQIAEIMELPPGYVIDPDKPLNELGLESLMAVELRNRLQDRFRLEIPITSIWEHRTLNALLGKLAAAVEPAPSLPLASQLSPQAAVLAGDAAAASILLPLQTKGTRPPLYCVHSATGEAVSYGLFCEGLGLDQPVYGLQSLGFTDPSYLPQSVEEMARRYARIIDAHRPSGDLHLFGQSAGGFFAFATAYELERLGRTVAFVGISDSRHLSDYGQTEEEQHGAVLMSTARVLGVSLTPEEHDSLVKQSAGMSEEERGGFFFERLRDRGMKWLVSNQGEWDQWSRLARRLAVLNNSFVPPGKVAAPLAVWLAREEPVPKIDWRQHSTGFVHREIVEGNHITMLQGDNLARFLASLKSRLVATDRQPAAVAL